MSQEHGNEAKAFDKSSNPLRAVWVADPKRPIYSALLEAALQRFDQLFNGSIIHRMEHAKNVEEAREICSELIALAQEATEILEWLSPHTPLPLDLAIQVAEVFRKPNLPEEVWRGIIRRAERRERGRPITKRLIAIQALELKLFDGKKWTHQRIAQKLCDCGNEIHDKKCSESIRQSVLGLKRILKKYCSDLHL